MSCQELADHTGISVHRLRKIENEHTPLHAEEVPSVAAVLGIPVAALLEEGVRIA